MSSSRLFRELHEQSQPLLIANCWDPLSALVIEQSGAHAVATTSWGMSNHQGLVDGEQLTFEQVYNVVKAILKVINIPLSVDIEAGYSLSHNEIINNVLALATLGVAGINIEDKPSSANALRGIEEHTTLLKTLKNALRDHGFADFFINARCDLCFQENWHTPQLLTRAKAYQEAGADCFFIPGLTDPAVLKELAQAMTIPINVMVLPQFCDLEQFKHLGIKRVSTGNALSDHLLTQLELSAEAINHSQNLSFLFENTVQTRFISA
ncbi:isocitrate lyase/PEP mutase family protein [Pseudoalteromonas sp. SSDWG2]|uniref:isocitrate lyase/PEP mutase family protein n=1 Tax=Pseudoalteromonas sp. SSDWG2 TaxID=3139391 RepID=UPI003BA93DCF